MTGERRFLLSQDTEELLVQIGVIVLIDVIDRLVGKPVRGMDEFDGARAGPFEVDEGSDVPIFVDEDVAAVEVG